MATTLFFFLLTSESKHKQIALAGSLAPSGSITPFVTISRSGQIIPSGTHVPHVPIILESSPMIFSDVDFAVFQSMAGSLGSSGSVGNEQILVHNVEGEVTPSGTDEHIPGVSLVGIAALSGVILSDVFHTLAGMITPSSVLGRLATKDFSGTITPSGTQTPLSATLHSVSGSMSPSGGTAHGVMSRVSGAVASASSLVRAVSSAFSGMILPFGAGGDIQFSFVSGVLSFVGALVSEVFELVVQIDVELEGQTNRTVNSAGAMNRTVNTSGTANRTVNLVGHISRR